MGHDEYRRHGKKRERQQHVLCIHLDHLLIRAGKSRFEFECEGVRSRTYGASFVMPGLDPGIHAPQAVDCRVEPGADDFRRSGA
jgi:hypothetical protein